MRDDAAALALPPFALGRIPRIEFGAGVVDRVPGIVAGLGSSALLITGGASLARSGRRAALLDGLAESGVEVRGEAAAVGEPSPALVDGIVDRNRDAGIEVVIGVGGGSVLDTAKAVAGLLRTGTSVVAHLEGLPGRVPYPGPAVPFVAVPTTAGTGSEATRNAVITERGPDGYKRSFRDERLVAAWAVVDPDLLAGSGPVHIATQGMDALTQLLEPYVSTKASPITDALAVAGLEAARDGLLAWHADPDGATAPAARSRMAFAALLSGVCLAHAGLGAVHGLASPLGGRFPVPHGGACGATLAAVTRANLEALGARDPDSPALSRYARLGRLLAGLPDGTPDDLAHDALVETLSAWSTRLRVPGLATYGIGEPELPAIIADARGSSMRTNPVVLTDDELATILRASR